MPGENVSDEAWVTLATSDQYCLGALAVAGSLRQAGTTRRKVVMVTREVTSGMRTSLEQMFDEIVDVDSLDSGDAEHLTLLRRPELGITFTKLHCWKLIQYKKCVFLDADTLVLQNCDELFDREELSAAPDSGWPDCFNSGVFVFRPSQETFDAIINLAEEEGSFDGGDQGLLNTFFSDWATKDISKHLPFVYNMTATASYTYLPAIKRFGRDVKIIHFIGSNKPWTAKFSQAGEPLPREGEGNAVDHLQRWWQVYHAEVRGLLDHRHASAGDQFFYGERPAYSASGQPRHPQQPREDQRHSWETGQPDFRGSASFDKIIKKIETTLSTPATEEPKK